MKSEKFQTLRQTGSQLRDQKEMTEEPKNLRVTFLADE